MSLMISDTHYDHFFPSLNKATAEGLVAVGGNLSRRRLLAAYHQGIFPWYNEGQSIMWWSPDPRTVLFIGEIKISRSLKKTMRNGRFMITIDVAFEKVIQACAAPRNHNKNSWITGEMCSAYCDLYKAGDAHSVEVWRDNILVGGLYGVAIGKIFCGESMFSLENNASKIALVALHRYLQKIEFRLIDCQLPSNHLFSLGAENITRDQFLKEISRNTREEPINSWNLKLASSNLA